LGLFLDHAIILMEIALINMLLSGDNAIVIAMAARRLPYQQRRRAMWWGTAAAVLLRCILTMGAIALLRIPFLQTAGALLLLLIAYKLVAEREEGETHAPGASSLSGAVWTIVTADFVMSLDNVLAVTAVSGGDIPLLLIGIVMSIPIIIWGSSFFMRLMDKAPWLVYAGGALLAYTAGKMVLHDDGLAMWLPQLQAGRISEALPWLLASALLMAALVMRWRSAPRKPD
jgi:YjbE family integral membrane protein